MSRAGRSLYWHTMKSRGTPACSLRSCRAQLWSHCRRAVHAMAAASPHTEPFHPPTSAPSPGPCCAALHLWSLAVQVHFYLTFPVLLCALRPRAPGFRARLSAALATTFAAGVAWRLQLAFKASALQVPYGDSMRRPSEWAAFVALSSAGYFPTGARLPALALGAAMGLALRSPAATSWLLRRCGEAAKEGTGWRAVPAVLLDACRGGGLLQGSYISMSATSATAHMHGHVPNQRLLSVDLSGAQAGAPDGGGAGPAGGLCPRGTRMGASCAAR